MRGRKTSPGDPGDDSRPYSASSSSPRSRPTRSAGADRSRCGAGVDRRAGREETTATGHGLEGLPSLRACGLDGLLAAPAGRGRSARISPPAESTDRRLAALNRSHSAAHHPLVESRLAREVSPADRFAGRRPTIARSSTHATSNRTGPLLADGPDRRPVQGRAERAWCYAEAAGWRGVGSGSFAPTRCPTARSSTASDPPRQTRAIERQEFEYKRRGTVNVLVFWRPLRRMERLPEAKTP